MDGTNLLDRVDLPAPYAARIGSLRRLIDDLNFEIDPFAGLARGRLVRQPGYTAVQNIPGIGPFRAAVFVAEIGDVGSPRLHVDLRDAGWTVPERTVPERTVADSMRRQGLVARIMKRRNGLTKQDKTAPTFPDLVRRDVTAARANQKWVGDITWGSLPLAGAIPTSAGKLYVATVIDLYSRRLLGAATSRHPDADLACAATRMAAAVRGGTDAIRGVIFHTDRGSTYTATDFTNLCRTNKIRQSMGRVGSCSDCRRR